MLLWHLNWKKKGIPGWKHELFTKTMISDYMFIKDRLFASLNLDDTEMNLYDSIANMMERNVINPDLIIYLQADTSTLMKNIDKRANKVVIEVIKVLDKVSLIEIFVNSKIFISEYFLRFSRTLSKITTVSLIE